MASEEDLTPDSLQDGSIQTFTGSNNVLIVVPNLEPDDEAGRYIAWFAFRLTRMLGPYGVMNCRQYRLPLQEDPSPEELRIPDGGKNENLDKKTTALRKRLLEKTRGIPVDLNSYSSASVAAPDYLEAIWSSACCIGGKAEPLVFFVQGIDDATADALDFDVAIGCGFVKEDNHVPHDAVRTARADLVDELLMGFQASRPELRIREAVQGYALESRDQWLGGSGERGTIAIYLHRRMHGVHPTSTACY